MQKEQEDSKGSQFKLSNITDAIVDVEKRNKTLDDALAEATQKLEQKSSQINKLLRDEAELAIKRSKIKREIDLFETAHKDEMSRYFQKTSQINDKFTISPFFLRAFKRKKLPKIKELNKYDTFLENTSPSLVELNFFFKKSTKSLKC